jgi:hypothetical protein
VYDRLAYLGSIFAPGFHYGAAILVFTSILLFLKTLQSSGISLRIFFLIFLTLAGLSDPLVYLYFTFPMLVTLTIFRYFKKLSNKDLMLYLFILSIAFILSHVIYSFIPIQHVPIHLKPTFDSLMVLRFLKTLLLFIGKNFVWGTLWILFIFWAPYSIWKSRKETLLSIKLIDYVILLQFVTVVLGTPLIMLAISQYTVSVNDHFPTASFWHDPAKFYNELTYIPYRYLINYLMGPVFLGYPLLLYKHYKNSIVKILTQNITYAIILVLFAVIIFSHKHHHFHKKNILQVQSNLTNCLLHYAARYDLTNGITDSYWITNAVNAYAKGKIHMALVTPNPLNPIHWQNTLQVYQYHHYNFVVAGDPPSRKMIETTTRRLYGKPTRILICEDDAKIKHRILVYSNGKLNKIFGP